MLSELLHTSNTLWKTRIKASRAFLKTVDGCEDITQYLMSACFELTPELNQAKILWVRSTTEQFPKKIEILLSSLCVICISIYRKMTA